MWVTILKMTEREPYLFAVEICPWRRKSRFVENTDPEMEKINSLRGAAFPSTWFCESTDTQRKAMDYASLSHSLSPGCLFF